MNNLLILGAGQHGQVVKEIAESMNFFDKIDYLDDNSNHAIGKFNDYEKYKDKYNYAFVAIGNTKLRMEWIEKLENAGYILKNIIHKTAIVSNSTKLENGIVVEAGVIINSNVVISKGVIISIGALIEHNVNVESGCHIRAGGVIRPNTVISENTIVLENTTI